MNLTYIAELDEAVTRLADVPALLRFLDQAEGLEHAHLWVELERLTRPTTLQRLFGSAPLEVTPCFSLSWAGDYARLTFYDPVWSEHRAMDPTQRERPTVGTRARLAGNEPTPASPEECLPTSRAFSAVRHFLKHDARPEWLTYRHVK